MGDGYLSLAWKGAWPGIREDLGLEGDGVEGGKGKEEAATAFPQGCYSDFRIPSL